MNLGISEGEAQKIVDAYFEVYPRIKVFVEECHKMAERNQWVYTPFAQRKMQYGTLPCFKGTAVFNAAMRNAQNVRIQGPASTLGLMAFSEVNRRVQGLDALSICTVYDSLELESPLARAAEVIETGFYCMDDWPQEKLDWLDFPIGADAEIGFSWGTLAKVHRGATQQDIETILKNLDPVKYERAKSLQAA